MINSTLKAFWQEEDGQDLVEYSLLLAFLALACVAILSQASTTIKALWQKISNALTSANSAAS